MSAILTLDLGTTYVKACLFDRAGQLLAAHRQYAPVAPVPVGHAEIPASAMKSGVKQALDELSRKAGGLRDVEAVTFASQTNSFLLADSHDRPLTPFLLWSDNRAEGAPNPLAELADQPEFLSRTGLPGVTSQFAVAKLAWLRANRPHVCSRASKFLLVSDWLAWWLTGSAVTEAGVSGLLGVLDIHRLSWWPEACEAAGLPESWLPEVVRAGADIGRLRPKIAQELGLPKTCRFIVGCLDQYAGVLGAGGIAPGTVSETTGTVLATVRCAAKFDTRPRPGVYQGPGPVPDLCYQMVFSGVSGALLEAYQRSLPDRPSFASLDAAAAAVPPDAELPRLHDAAAIASGKPLFAASPAAADRGRCVRAILTAVARELRRQVDVLCGDARPQAVYSAGGAARSKLWRHLKSEALGCPVIAVKGPEPTSLGAAMLAASALSGDRLSQVLGQRGSEADRRDDGPRRESYDLPSSTLPTRHVT